MGICKVSFYLGTEFKDFKAECPTPLSSDSHEILLKDQAALLISECRKANKLEDNRKPTQIVLSYNEKEIKSWDKFE